MVLFPHVLRGAVKMALLTATFRHRIAVVLRGSGQRSFPVKKSSAVPGKSAIRHPILRNYRSIGSRSIVVWDVAGVFYPKEGLSSCRYCPLCQPVAGLLSCFAAAADALVAFERVTLSFGRTINYYILQTQRIFLGVEALRERARHC